MPLKKVTIFPTEKKLKCTVQSFKPTIISLSTLPISNVKLKRVSKVYHVLCNDFAGINTTSTCQCINESMRNTQKLLDYVTITTHIKINWKRLHVPIIRFYKLAQFHIQRKFCASLSV